MERFSPFPFSDLSAFLRNPVITVRVSKADDLLELRTRLEKAEREMNRLLGLYTQECEINLRLVDILRENGIRWR